MIGVVPGNDQQYSRYIATEMEQSVFTDKEQVHDPAAIDAALGKNAVLWRELIRQVSEQCPQATEQWHFSKSGWNCRVKDKKRVIIYLMPGNRCFQMSVVLGQKAAEQALAGSLSQATKEVIRSAKVYAEGRGVRFEVHNKKIMPDLMQLIDIKLAH